MMGFEKSPIPGPRYTLPRMYSTATVAKAISTDFKIDFGNVLLTNGRDNGVPTLPGYNQYKQWRCICMRRKMPDIVRCLQAASLYIGIRFFIRKYFRIPISVG